MLTLLIWLQAALAAQQIDAVDHTATLLGETITWESRVLLSGGGEQPLELALAVPLEAPVEVDEAVEVVTEDGLATALVVSAGRTQLLLRTTQAAPEGQADALRPPLLATEAVQRVDLDGVRWVPDPALGLERRMRHIVPAGMTRGERRQVDRRLDGRPVPKGSRVYVVADRAVVGAGGLLGPVDPAGQVPLTVAIGVGGLFVAVLGGGLLGYRLLDGQARRERLDAYMQDEFVRQELEGRAVDGAGV